MRIACLLLLLPLCMPGADRYKPEWLSVANRLVETDPGLYEFNWGEGVQWIGLMKTYERTGEKRYVDYMERWTASYAGRDPRVLLNGVREGYCGHWSPATAILLLNEARPRAEYAKLARRVVDYITNEAERSSEGALGHWQGSHQLWVDTLYMACPLLAEAGKAFSKPEYITDAARQIVVYAKHLQDDRSGLFYHMWDWKTGERTPALWGRGNGWVTMSLADTLEVMEAGHPLRGKLVEIAKRQAEGLARTQDGDGLWHTVLDEPSSYPESSATSMVVYGLKKLARLGVLEGKYRAMAERGWKAVNQRYVRDGVVIGVSAGTEPRGKEYYGKLPAGSQTWGTGAYLLAGSEMER